MGQYTFIQYVPKMVYCAFWKHGRRLCACHAKSYSTKLAALKSSLRARMAASPLCDAKPYARKFEDALRGIWREWCATRRPAR